MSRPRRREWHVQRRHVIAVSVLALVVVGGLWSYFTGGTVRLLLEEQSLDALRGALARWGRLAPVVYVAAVVIEVLVAPIPGTLLYAPGGALFGGLLGGTLSLIGNTVGAAIACGVGSAIGEEALARRVQGTRLATYREAILARGIWVVMLLRVNPLTSSDAVSYMAGAAGVPIWRVTLGTFLGMAPLCYAQAYLAQQIFEVLPGAVYVLAVAGLVYLGALIWWLTRK